MNRIATIARTRSAPLAATVAAGGVMVGVLFSLMSGRAAAEGAQKQKQQPNKVFKGGPAFVSLPLESSEDVNHNVKRLRFRLPDGAVSGLEPTSAILTVSWPNGGWRPAPRPYTPISPLDEPGILELLVKKYPGGRASSHLHSLTPGDTLLFAAPLRGYKWRPNSHSNVTLIAGGAGITPIFQLAQEILRNPDDRTAVDVIVAANTDDDILLKPELDAFARRFPGRVSVTYTVTRPSAQWAFRKGYVTAELVREVTARSGGARGGDAKVFVCGPPAMEAALVGDRWSWSQGVLAQLGYRRDQVHKF